MTTASLLTLPVEIIHCIFSYCNTETIILSIRPVCKRLYSIVNGYNQFELTLDSKTKSNFQLIYRLVPPEGITKLNIMRGEYGSSYMKFFHSICNICHLTRLHSLNIQYIGEKDLVELFEMLNTNTLTSLSIGSYEKDISKILLHIISAIDKFRIQKLFLNQFNYVIKHMSLPVDCTVTHLEIGACHYDEYITVLQRLPNLQKMLMKECVINDKNATTTANSDIKFCSLLKSLTITEFSLSAQQLESLISFTPELVHLKLTALKYRNFDYVFYGMYWENFIRSNLSSLKKFEICFCSGTNAVNDLAELITPFRTPFWTKEKHWLIACAFFVHHNNKIWLYTLPISVYIEEDPVRCEMSSRDGICRLTKRRLNEVFDTTPDEVSKDIWSGKTVCNKRSSRREINRYTST